jgi:hypothetical protein
VVEKGPMKIAWIFPQNKLCGISFYSQKYVQALRRSISIECLDPLDYCNNRKAFLEAIQSCDVCHIQYETSFFLLNNKDFFFSMCSEIKCPIIVTLHEVYKQFPDVFPRDKIKGNLFTKPIKEHIYDKRHPFATSFARHVSKGFCADKIIVHAQFQKDVLIATGLIPRSLLRLLPHSCEALPLSTCGEGTKGRGCFQILRSLFRGSSFEKGLVAGEIDVLPIPVLSIDNSTQDKWKNDQTLNLAATGFINPSYDYDVLFKTLDLCDMPWKFTWIGGVRRQEDQALLDTIQADVAKRGWENRFVITGKISDKKRDAMLSSAHIYCALFKHKSSSESLATAIGSRSLIIATRLPLTEEMTSELPVMHLVENDPKTVVVAIKKINSDARMRESLTNACEKYTLRYSYENMAKCMVSEYERLLSA